MCRDDNVVRGSNDSGGGDGFLGVSREGGRCGSEWIRSAGIDQMAGCGDGTVMVEVLL